MIALFQGGDSRTNVNDDSGTFVAENDGKQAFRIGTRAGELVRMAHTAGLDFDQDLTRLGTLEIDFDHFQRFSRRVCDCSFRFHATLISTARTGIDPVRGERESLPAAYVKLIWRTAPSAWGEAVFQYGTVIRGFVSKAMLVYVTLSTPWHNRPEIEHHVRCRELCQSRGGGHAPADR